jgi:hypothetical protein
MQPSLGKVVRLSGNIHFNYPAGRGYYVPNMSDLVDGEFVSDFNKRNANIFLLAKSNI